MNMNEFKFAVSVIGLSVFLHVSALPLYVPFYGETSGGFHSAARGWNSFGLQANPQVNPNFTFNQENVLRQCLLLRTSPGHDTYCSLDSTWSVGANGDEYGRLIPDINFPNITQLAEELHSRGLKLGVYVLPGAFNNDEGKFVFGTNITIGSLFNRTEDPTGETCNNYLARSNFDYGKDGVRQWHESVIELFASWGVDFIKLDFVTPGSPQGGCMPYDSSLSVKFYRDAIDKIGRPMRLGLSWKLDRREPYWSRWRKNADSLRTDQDINNGGQPVFVSREVVQRAINHYRLFIIEQIRNESRHGQPINIRPDMDNSYIGNPEHLSGLTNHQRYTMAMTWMGAGANLITGSDMTAMDSLGEELLWNDEALEIVEFCSQWPMQPRNPDGSGTPGGDEASQLQVWIAGPNPNGTAVVIQSNFGPDLGQGGFGSRLEGTQSVNITLESLGIAPGMPDGGSIWSVRRVWGGEIDHFGPWNLTSSFLETRLGPGESVLYKLTRLVS